MLEYLEPLRKATNSLPASVYPLLRSQGVEDGGEVVWCSFTDDGGATVLICHACRDHVAQVFGSLELCLLVEAIATARNAGKTRELWGEDLCEHAI